MKKTLITIILVALIAGSAFAIYKIKNREINYHTGNTELYSVSYKLPNGKTKTISVGEGSYELDKVVNKNGYTFNGWLLNGKLVKKIDIKSNVNLEPYFTSKKTTLYTIDFISNTKLDISQTKVEKGKKIVFPEDPKQEGYTFLGWYLENGTKVNNYIPTNNTKIYAKWEKIPAKVEVEQDNTITDTNNSISNNEEVNNIPDTHIKEDNNINIEQNNTQQNNGEVNTNVNNTINVTDISLSNYSIELKPNQSSTIKAVISPANATDKTVTWTSSNSNVATVDAYGKITAISPGSTTVIVQTGSIKKEIKVTVSENQVQTNVSQISINKIGTLKVGQNIKLKVTTIPKNITGKVISYSSSNPEIATVDSNGSVSAMKVGKTTITAQVDGVIGQIEVNVGSISFERNSITLGGLNASYHLNAVTENIARESLTYISNNPDIVSVDNNGNITAKASSGEAIITARFDSVSKSIKIYVINEILINKKEAYLAAQKEYLTLSSGNTSKVKALNVRGRDIKWISNTPDVIAIDNDGNITARKSASKVTVTAVLDNIKTTMYIKVRPVKIAIIGSSKSFYGNVSGMLGYCPDKTRCVHGKKCSDGTMCSGGSNGVFYRMLLANDIEAEIYKLTQSSTSLLGLYDIYGKTIENSKYDRAIIQDTSEHIRAVTEDKFNEYDKGVKKIVKALKNKNENIKIYLRETYPAEKFWTTNPVINKCRIYDGARILAQKYELYLIKDGHAFEEATNKKYDLYYTDRAHHNGTYGSYLISACMYKALFGDINSNYNSIGFEHNKVALSSSKIDINDAKILQQIANNNCGNITETTPTYCDKYYQANN